MTTYLGDSFFANILADVALKSYTTDVVLKTLTINGQALNGNITLNASDIGAASTAYVDAALAALIGTANSANDTLGEIATSLASLTTTVAGKVDIVSGKGLSTNDFTSALLTKLNGIATSATANSSDATLLARANHTGTQSADTIVDGTTNKVFTATMTTKLAGIATGATANANTDALSEGSTNLYFTNARSQAAAKMVSGTTVKTGSYPVFKGATTTSGVATFHLTADGLSTGTALFPNGVDVNSFNFFANDSSNMYTYSFALSNGNKTVSVTAKALNLLALGLANAANGTSVYLSAWGN